MDDIGGASASCLRAFEQLTSLLTSCRVDFRESMPLEAIHNQAARFKIWAGNLGALQRGGSSLDARLRDSTVVRVTVIKLLKHLQDALENGWSLMLLERDLLANVIQPLRLFRKNDCPLKSCFNTNHRRWSKKAE